MEIRSHFLCNFHKVQVFFYIHKTRLLAVIALNFWLTNLNLHFFFRQPEPSIIDNLDSFWFWKKNFSFFP